MSVVQQWTGREAGLLQKALRLSLTGFAEHLGVGLRTVSKWREGGTGIVPRPDTQAILDTALARADADARTRFLAMLGENGGLVQILDNPNETRDTGVEAGSTTELMTVIVRMLRGLVDGMNRRDLLKLLGAAASGPLFASILGSLDLDEQERVLHAISTPERVDAQVIDHIDNIVYNSLVSDSRLGPQSAFHTVWAQQGILRQMIADCPEALRPRLLSVLGNALRVCGWLTFNLGDLPRSLTYYEQARTFAHDAQDVQLAAFVLANMTHVAVWSDSSKIAVDYSVAAVNWAKQADNPALAAFVSDMAAVSLSATGEYETAMRHLDGTQSYLSRLPESGPSPFYNYSEALHTARRGECLINLGRTADAIPIIEESLKSYEVLDANSGNDGMIHIRDIAVGKLNLSKAHAVAGDIDACAGVLTSVFEIVEKNRSNRIVNEIHNIREKLQPWQSEPVVRNLDEQFRVYSLV